MVVEQGMQILPFWYFVESHKQVVGSTIEKVSWQRVQAELEVQDLQFTIASEQLRQVEGGLRYSVEAQEVQVVPLVPVLHKVQKVALSH